MQPHFPFHSFHIAEEDFSLLIKLLEFKSSDIYIDANIKIFHDKFTKKNKTFVVYLTSGVGVQLSPYAQTEVTIITTNGNDDDDGNRGGKFFVHVILKHISFKKELFCTRYELHN